MNTPNAVKASYLIFGQVVLGIVYDLLYPNWRLSLISIVINIISLILTVGLAVVVRQGYSWTKYLLLILSIFIIISYIIHLISVFHLGMPQYPKRPAFEIINFIDSILMVWATFLLFKAPKLAETKQ